MTTARYCTRCGYPVASHFVYCEQCGALLPAEKPQKKKRTKASAKMIIAIIIALLLVAGTASAVTIILISRKPAAVKLPDDASSMQKIVKTAKGYLSPGGARLLGNRADEADIYAVSAYLDTKENEIRGDMRLLFTNRSDKSLDKIVLRVYSNADFVKGDDSRSASITNCTLEGKKVTTRLDGSLLYIEPTASNTSLDPNKSVMVKLSFTEPIPNVAGAEDILSQGFEQLLGQETGGYGIYGHTEEIYSLGHWMPTVVYYDNQGWHEDKALAMGDISDFSSSYYQVSIDVPSNMVVAAPGVKLGEKGGGGRKILSYAGGPMHEFTIQASTNYQTQSQDVEGVTVTSYFSKGAEASGQQALEVGSKAIVEFSKHFGPFVYRSINLCEAPMTGGAAGMEYPGLIQLAQMFYGDFGLGSLMPEEMGEGMEELEGIFDLAMGGLMGDTFEFVIAHEVAHQWWCHGVGSDSINHPWIDEALTNYSAVLYFRWVHGEEAAKAQRDTQLALGYQSAGLLGGGDTKVDQAIKDFSDQTQYTAVVYCKGALFYEALENLIGQENFEKDLKDYYAEYVFRDATPQDLLAAMQEHAPDPAAVAALYHRWIEEIHGDEDIGSGLDLPGLENWFEDFDMENPLEGMEGFWEQLRESEPNELLDDLMERLGDELFR